MAVMDMAFKALTAGLGVTTLYLAGTFSVNVYRGLAWHSEQSVSVAAAQPPYPPPHVPDPFPRCCVSRWCGDFLPNFAAACSCRIRPLGNRS
jgi:hypothetical protein